MELMRLSIPHHNKLIMREASFEAKFDALNRRSSVKQMKYKRVSRSPTKPEFKATSSKKLVSKRVEPPKP